jgi:hypothetical protein
MAQTSWPFENIDTSEAQFSAWARNIGEGIRADFGGELAVSADGADMTVDVLSGQALVRGHYYDSSSTEVITIPAADATNPRIDTLVLKLDPTANTITLVVVEGTPGASPSAPELTQTESLNYEFPLADIAVAANAVAISSGDVTDRRTFIGVDDSTIQKALLSSTGDMLYASSASNPARLAIGSEGEVLTVSSGIPAWEALPAGGTITWDFVGNTTPTTGVSSITITGLTGYKKYLLRFNGIKSSSACYWNMKINNVDYTWAQLKLIGNGSASSFINGQNYLARTSNATTTALYGSVYVEFNSADGQGHYIVTTGSNGTSSTDENYTATFTSFAPTTSLVIQLSAGTVSSGTYSIFGGN